MTTPVFVWCIAGDFSAPSVGNFSTTMTPDGDAGCSHFCTADSASSLCSHHLRQCC